MSIDEFPELHEKLQEEYYEESLDYFFDNNPKELQKHCESWEKIQLRDWEKRIFAEEYLGHEIYKDKKEFIKTEEFEITDFICETNINSQTIKIKPSKQISQNENRIIEKQFDDIFDEFSETKKLQGPTISRYSFKVIPKNKNLPIKEIYFEGNYNHIEESKPVLVTMFVGEIENRFFQPEYLKINEVNYYFQRDIKTCEEALEIKIQNSKGQTRTYRSIKYQDFFPRESLF